MRRALALLAVVVGCSGPGDVECRRDMSVASALVGGATLSSYVRLSPGQEAALVGIHFPVEDAWCSGVLIADSAVITARHCIVWSGDSAGFQLIAGRGPELPV